MKNTLFLLPFIFLTTTGNCQSKNKLSLYKHFAAQGNPANFAIQGVYYTIEHDYSLNEYGYPLVYRYIDNHKMGHSIYFYGNGTCLESGGWLEEIRKGIKDTSLFMDKVIQHDRESLMNDRAWGFYFIQKDTLYMEHFGRCYFGNCNLLKEKWIIRGRAIYKLSETWILIDNVLKGRQTKTYLINDTIGNIFYPSNVLKPDSSKAWFYDKDWFQNTIIKK